MEESFAYQKDSSSGIYWALHKPDILKIQIIPDITLCYKKKDVTYMINDIPIYMDIFISVHIVNIIPMTVSYQWTVISMYIV